MQQGYDPFNPPKIEQIGILNNSSNGVDYTQFSNRGFKVSGIKVSWNHKYINGIEFAYQGNPAGPILGSDQQNTVSEICNFNQNDRLLEVSGRYNNGFITCLYIRTKQGITKTWGYPLGGQEFSFFKSGSIISALKIRASHGVEYIAPAYELDLIVWEVLSLGGENVTKELKQSVKGDEEFNDFEFLRDKFNYKVKKVSLWDDGKYLNGIQFHYEMDGVLKSPGQHTADSNSNPKKKIIELSEGEFLESALALYSNDWISYLCLATNKGQKLEAGNKESQGNMYLLKVPANQQIICSKGEFNTFFRKIGFNHDEYYGL